MTVSVSNPKSQFEKVRDFLDRDVRMTVTGVDVKGQMFRHPATVLMLDGCDCAFRSESQPELNGSVLVEFDYPNADPKRRVSQACVKSNQAEIGSGSYRVVVELEVAQTVKVVPKQVEPQTAVEKPVLPLVPVGTVGPAEGKGRPVIAPRELPSPPKSNGIPQTVPRPKHEDSATIKFESRELLPKMQAEDPIAVREAAKSAVASDIKQEINLLKSWISSELERILPGIVSSNMENMIREAVKKQLSVNHETSLQALNADVARQVGDRIAESKDLRTVLESMAKKLFEEQTELSRTARVKVGQELSSRAAAIIRSFDESIAEMEARINASCGDMEVVLTKSRVLQQTTAELSARTAQFENQINNMTTERAVQFSMEMEKHLAAHRQRADETVEKLGAVLQLVEGTVRVQQGRLTEYSKTTAAHFEKEIRAILLRLAGGA